MLYAFWPVDAHGRPHPDAADAWGDPCPFDALDLYDNAGSFLTVVSDGALVFSGDVSHVLLAFAAETARRTGHPVRGTTPSARALDALRTLADDATDDAGAAAVRRWRTPDPETVRRGPLPDPVRRTIRHDARAHGRAQAADALARHLAFITRSRLTAA